MRVQTVNSHTDPLFHRLIERFGEETDVHAVLNTRFNVRGEPMVETTLNAFATFAASGLDAVVFGRYMVTKPGS